jgi:hypothetical protein
MRLLTEQCLRAIGSATVGLQVVKATALQTIPVLRLSGYLGFNIDNFQPVKKTAYRRF